MAPQIRKFLPYACFLAFIVLFIASLKCSYSDAAANQIPEFWSRDFRGKRQANRPSLAVLWEQQRRRAKPISKPMNFAKTSRSNKALVEVPLLSQDAADMATPLPDAAVVPPVNTTIKPGEFRLRGKTFGCAGTTQIPLPIPTKDKRSFYACSPQKRTIEYRTCPTIGNMETLLFDRKAATCRPQSQLLQQTSGQLSKQIKQARSGRPGFIPDNIAPQKKIGGGTGGLTTACTTHTQCIDNAVCINSQCTCAPTHIANAGRCLQKIEPNHTGCTVNEQCTSVWPGTTCVVATGLCQCAAGQVAVETRDGTVCVVPGECPTNGLAPRLFDAATTTLSECGILPGTTTTIGCEANIDVYDCMNVYPDPQPGYCCPSRALACAQKQDVGTAGAAAGERWSFNPAADRCDRFQYLGSGGNANNFRDQPTCETYCKGRCRRGPPQYNVDRTSAVQTMVRCTNPGQPDPACAQNFQCSPSGSMYCCPTNDFICSNYGAVVWLFDTDLKYPSPGTAAAGVIPQERFYFNTATRQCDPFQFGGQGGNFNNFVSREECQSFCLQQTQQRDVCARGTPLMVNNVPTPCPCNNANYICTNNVCCPTPDSICNMPKETAPCLTPATRWWHNPANKICESFQGCASINNNFASQPECQQYCTGNTGNTTATTCLRGVPHINTATGLPTVCSPTATGGPYCPDTHECSFDGRTHSCCEMRTCTGGAGILMSMPNRVVQVCNGPGAACPETGYTCQADSWGQTTVCCQSSSTNPTQGGSACQPRGTALSVNGVNQPCPCTAGYTCKNNMCCPTDATICSLPRDSQTNCVNPTTRYWYNSATANCEGYSGCASMNNNFDSMPDCRNFCVGTPGLSEVCLNGQPHIDPQTGTRATCSTQRRRNSMLYDDELFQNQKRANILCPQTHECYYQLCCPIRTCPGNVPVQVNQANRVVQTCIQNQPNTCQAGYSCLLDTWGQTYVCCAGIGASPGLGVGGCPSGSVPLMTNGVPQQCTPQNNLCQPSQSYTCYIPPQSTVGVCCSLGLPGSFGGSACPLNMQQYPPQGPAQSCLPQASNCPLPFQCILRANGNGFACCATNLGGGLGYGLRPACTCVVRWCCYVVMRPATCCARYGRRMLEGKSTSKQLLGTDEDHRDHDDLAVGLIN